MKHVAVFGAGRIGRIHASNLALLPGIHLASICDPFETSAQALAQSLNATARSLEEVFADQTIDTVVIASPASTHSDLIQRAAHAGKHIFCEKPIDISTERALACAADVEQSGVACMLGFQRRFDPTFEAIKRQLDRGDIGEAEMLVITSRDPGPPPVEYLRQSGGIFLDMLIHDFDMFRWLLGEDAVWLSATGACLTDPAIGEAGGIDSSAVSIRTRSGRLCQINNSRRAAYGFDQRLEVLGSTGLLAAGNHSPVQVTHMSAEGASSANPEPLFLERYRTAYQREITHFFEQLQTGGSFRTTMHDGVAAQRLADAASHSLASGQAVQLEAV